MELLTIIIVFVVATIISSLVKSRSVIEGLAVIATGFSLLLASHIAYTVSVSGPYASWSFFQIDALSAIVLLIIGSISFAVTVYSVAYLRQETKKGIVGFTRVKQYFMLSNLFTAAMFLAISANSPIFAWISIEATTLSTAFLISFYNKPSAMEAAWKYLIINSVGLLLGFFGTLLYFTALSTDSETGFVSWQLLLDNSGQLDPLLAKIAFVFVLIGYGTKVGLAPMHTWLPDAHSKAPAPTSALLSGVLLTVAFVIILKFKIITDASVGADFSQQLLIVFGLLSIIISAFIIFNQKNYKRLLAYSSIENMGILALGFGFGGVGIFAAVLHLLYNSFTKSAMFLAIGTIFLKYSSTKIAHIRGAITALPITSVVLFAGLLSISGIPPFGTFLTKILILTSGMKAYPIFSMLIILPLTILFIGFFRHVVKMIFGNKPSLVKIGEDDWRLFVPPALLIGVVLYLSISIPPFLERLIASAVLMF
ncbi:hydrogenase [Candidatus Kaiserbacteria bacterium CG_4_8_14_3_um_filter_38_9]|uniref:Hydrogenase n=1 Tax=Candidatus Kaiserbacteria bacterium CG_4_8_14_3_um_filter_38_9 TaxID=1974599 RepID=A0A2M7INS4_9BACT|nr:MAG: hydrogenase [Candidatus Kaiserbacteria bacterium CG_4_8_14_3_um_filter_38_9]